MPLGPRVLVRAGLGPGERVGLAQRALAERHVRLVLLEQVVPLVQRVLLVRPEQRGLQERPVPVLVGRSCGCGVRSHHLHPC